VHGRRSAADGRDVYYSLDLTELGKLYLESGARIHPSVGAATPGRDGRAPAGARRIRVLFLCTHNSARSQMAEGLLRQLGGERFDVASAGTQPSQVHPLAIEAMKKLGVDISGHRSKPLEELVDQTFDYVVTVCDSANEACPIFPRAPERIHWSIQDPSTVTGTKAARLAAFHRAAEELSIRIRHLVAVIERERSG
jgi:thioredoxin type arsenate reductase